MLLILMSCDPSKLSKTPDSLFIGVWRLEGHGALDDVHVSIKKDGENKLEGRVHIPPDFATKPSEYPSLAINKGLAFETIEDY